MISHASGPYGTEQIIDAIAAEVMNRHPEFNPALVHAEVGDSYRRLAADSRVSDHLSVLVQHEVVDRLRATPAGR